MPQACSLNGKALTRLFLLICRDCSVGNIMMDAPSVFPNGFHPCHVAKDRGGFRRVKIIPRYKATGPIKYYLIDFGISRRYEEGKKRQVVGDDGADREVPEMSDKDFYDPFPADVFILGNVFKKHILPVSLLPFFRYRPLTIVLSCSYRITKT